MIIDMKPLSMSEAREIIIKSEKDEKNVADFIKKFEELNEKDAKDLRADLENLGLLKIKDEHIAKIIDLLPEDASDLNKIFVDLTLDENEVSKILEVTKKYK